jgi:NAD(P)-dependent dehydrogenase (short-subunit alcohol dehydrogenase family)
MDVADRVAIVTGAGGGIGGALARALAREGARVLAVDLDGDRAEAVASAIREGHSGAAIADACDVADEAALAAVIARAEAELGPVDVFCANAGVGIGQGIGRTEEEWTLALDVNVLAHVRAARLLLPGWLDRGRGYFLSTASAAGLLSQIGSAPYSVTKHAAVAFAEWLSMTYGDRGIAVGCLCPMGVNTPLLTDGLDAGSSEDARIGARAVMAAGTVLEPDDVADVVMAAIASEQFLILPHPEVQEFVQRKAADHDRWLRGMRRLQAQVQ